MRSIYIYCFHLSFSGCEAWPAEAIKQMEPESLRQNSLVRSSQGQYELREKNLRLGWTPRAVVVPNWESVRLITKKLFFVICGFISVQENQLTAPTGFLNCAKRFYELEGLFAFIRKCQQEKSHCPSPFCRDNFSPLSANQFRQNIQLGLSKSDPEIKFQVLIFWLKIW